MSRVKRKTALVIGLDSACHCSYNFEKSLSSKGHLASGSDYDKSLFPITLRLSLNYRALFEPYDLEIFLP